MKPITKSFLRLGAVLGLAFGFASLASAQNLTLRIVCYNIDCDTGSTAPLPGLIYPASGSTATTSGGALEGIGEEILADGVAQPVDVLALEETSGNAATVAPIVTGLNAYYSQYNPLASNMYAMAPQGYLTTGTGNGPSAMVYNTKTVQLVATVPVDPPGGTSQLGSASGEYREVMRYEFAPAGQTPTTATEFYVYVSHYKASTGSANEQDRYKEAVIIRNNETNLPANARVLYVGDYNPDSGSSETGYQAIIAANSPGGVAQGQGVDPLNVSGSTTIDWEDSTTNKTILFMLTEESYELRYRDDLQICTTNVYNGTAGGLALVAGTYHAFGNNASIAWGSSVNSGGNTALTTDLAPGSHLSASTIYADLAAATDHLPVVADYTIPVVQPGAIFTATPTSALPPLTVTFSDASTGIVTNWNWDFGDGATSNTSTTLSVAHTYTSAGVYSVTETVTGPGGASTNTQTGLITVLTPFQVWQLQYFGSTNSAQAQPTADADGTGQNNYFKYVAGLNPTNPASVFVFNIAGVSNQATWMNLVYGPVAAGRSYIPLSASQPNGAWAALTSAAAPPVTNGTQVTVTDTNAVQGQTFYEMEITLP